MGQKTGTCVEHVSVVCLASFINPRLRPAESQTPGGEASEGENEPQPGEPENSSDRETGKDHTARVVYSLSI